MPLVLVTPPLQEPVSLAEAKAWLRLDTSDEDDLIAALITSARLVVETTTRRALIAQGWRLILDGWPPDALRLPLAPFIALGGIVVTAADGSVQTVQPAQYSLDASPEAARLALACGLAAPRSIAGIAIDFTVGYGDTPASVPQALRHAILALVAAWHANRGEATTVQHARLPDTAEALIAPWRRLRLA